MKAEVSMFFWKKRKAITPSSVTQPVGVATAEIEAPAQLAIPDSYPAKPVLNAPELEEYERIATAIGLTESGSLTDERLRQCFVRENIHIFNPSQVAEFLNRKMGKGKWEWRGLRASDVSELEGWTAHHGEHRINFGDRQYALKVPLPVLLTVQRILEEVPEAHFYVSHPIDTGEDPFLMVTTKESQSFIIERWDEPDFRER